MGVAPPALLSPVIHSNSEEIKGAIVKMQSGKEKRRKGSSSVSQDEKVRHIQ